MLEADAVDALDISATLHIHHTAALKGINAGKHCLVQKPLAISVAAGRAIVEAARQRGVALGVMENLRFAQGARVARWLIDQGYLGQVQMIARWASAHWSGRRTSSSQKPHGGITSCSLAAVPVWTSGCICCTSCAISPVRSTRSQVSRASSSLRAYSLRLASGLPAMLMTRSSPPSASRRAQSAS